MGSWATQAATKNARCREIEKESNWDTENTKSVLLGKRVTTSGLWTLQEITNHETKKVDYILTIHMMTKHDGQWWVKSIYTGCGSCYDDCPKPLVDQWLKLNGGKFENEWEENWYSKWKQSQNIVEKAQSLKSGDVVTVNDETVTFERWYTKNRNKFVGTRQSDNKRFWYYTRQISEF